MKRLLCFVLASSLIFGAVACSKKTNDTIKSDNISENVTLGNDYPINLVDTLDEAYDPLKAFGLELFQKGYEHKGNYMVSPISVITALSMTANGADGNTLKQMSDRFGMEQIDINAFMGIYLKSLNDDKNVKLKLANSIWTKDDKDFTVNVPFLQANKAYYGCDVFKSGFDSDTVDDINSWISLKTDGMIKNMIDEIDEKTVMFLINAICFDAKWQEIYNEYQMTKGDFHNYDGTVNKEATLMESEENKYLEDDKATGFIKNYEGGSYGLAVLLPNEGVDVFEYVESLKADDFYRMVTSPKDVGVIATLPAFSSEYSTSLADALKSMGMTDAFDSDVADFSKLGRYSGGNIYIGNVLHKTFIQVDAQGTKAGAATVVQMDAESCMQTEIKTVKVDRPFVYAIINNATGMPLFMGVEANIE